MRHKLLTSQVHWRKVDIDIDDDDVDANVDWVFRKLNSSRNAPWQSTTNG